MGGPYGSEGYNEYLRRQQELAAKREAEAKAKRDAAAKEKADQADVVIEELEEMSIDERKVVHWRLKQLRDAGMDYDHAILLAHDSREVDLHVAVELTKRAGSELAYRILANA